MQPAVRVQVARCAAFWCLFAAVLACCVQLVRRFVVCWRAVRLCWAGDVAARLVQPSWRDKATLGGTRRLLAERCESLRPLSWAIVVVHASCCEHYSRAIADMMMMVK